MTRPPKPRETPPVCPRCQDKRVWWPFGASDSRYAPACVWCDSDAMSDAPDDCDHDADTILEPKGPT